MILLDSVMDLTFTVKDLIIIIGFLIPMIMGFVALKWRVNKIENDVKDNRQHYSDFKEHVYKKFDDVSKTEKEISRHLNNIEIALVKIENNVYKSILDAVGKLYKNGGGRS